MPLAEALVPLNGNWYEAVIQAIADRYEIDLDTPWQELTEEQQHLFLNGTKGERIYVSYRNRMGRKRSYMLAFEGLVTNLQRRYRETDSSSMRERIEEYMSFRPCPECNGAGSSPRCSRSRSAATTSTSSRRCRSPARSASSTSST